MIEPLDDVRSHDRRERIEIHDHAGGGAGRLEGAGNGDFDAIRMPVQARALPRMVRQHVRRLEAEGFSDDHDLLPFGVAREPSGRFLEIASRPHRFQALFEFAEERICDRSVDHTVVE